MRKKSGLQPSKVDSSHQQISEVSELPNPASRNVEFLFWLLAVCVVGIIFLIIKMYNIHPYIGDEGIYISQGKLVANGLVPYKDFSLAHPPVQTLFIAFVYQLFGYDLFVFRMIPALWSLFGGVLIAVLVRKELGIWASIFAMSFYILAYEPLRASIHFTGVNMTIALLMVAFLTQRNKQWISCAVFCVLAVFTRLYALPAVLALLIFTCWENKENGIKLFKYGAGMGFLTFVAIGFWTGFSALINNVFLFQSNKTSMQEDQVDFMRDAVLFHNSIPFALFLIGTITWLIYYFKNKSNNDQLARNKKVKVGEKLNLSLVGFSIFTVFFILMILLNMSRVWMYYYVLAFPFAAITSGWMVSQWIDFLKGKIVKNKLDHHLNNLSATWASASIFLFVIFYFASCKLEHRLDYYKEAMRNPAKKTASYTWVDGRVPEFINQIMKSVFWEDVRVVGDKYSSVTYYLWHSSRVFDIADEMVNEVAKRCTPADSIFGDSGTVPLLSLMSNRGIAGNFIDTNSEQFRSGNIDAKVLVNQINKPTTRLIILRDKFGVATIPEIQRLVQMNYKEVKALRSNTGFTLRVFERI